MKKWFKIFLFFVGFLVLWKTISSASCVPLISLSHLHTPNTNTPHVFLIILGNQPSPQSRAKMSGSSFQPLAQLVSPEAVSWEAVSCLDPERPGFPAPPPSLPPGPLLRANAGLLPPAPHQEGGCPFVWSLSPFSSRLVLMLSWTHRAGSYCQHTVLSDSHAPVHACVLISDKTSSLHTEFWPLYSFKA